MPDQPPRWPPVTDGNGAPESGIPPPVRPVRWGIGDFLFASLVGVVGATVATVPFVRSDGTIPISGLVASLIGQSAAVLGYLELIARRKGRGSLVTDFGLALRLADWWWLLLGLGFSLLAGLALLPISDLAGGGSGQEVVKEFQRSQGTVRILFAVGVVVLAPFIEELLYRGLLLRSLLRRMSPARAVFVSAVVFGLAHVLGDPGSYVVLPALIALGIVSAIQAVRTGTLSRSIYLHAGFNLLTTVQILGVVHVHLPGVL